MNHPFQSHNPAFAHLLGTNPRLECLHEKSYPFAHEAGVFFPVTKELFVTSNRLSDESGTQRVQISRLVIGDTSRNTICEEIVCKDIEMANGGVNYDGGMLICAQGNFMSPSGLYRVQITPPFRTTLITAGFYGRTFNSVNDVVIHSDGSIWFTDPAYGFEQGYRERPLLPSQVYRFQPRDGAIRAMADGFGHPNGICFSPAEDTVYITDTDYISGTGAVDATKASSIYAFDVDTRTGQPFLTNRRLFAMCDVGVPDGIKCDMEGNVYSGCGDGLNIWSRDGTLLGRVRLGGGVANFCFGNPGELFLLNETRLWRVNLSGHVTGAMPR